MIEKLGKYQVIEQIGRGGMGVVYKANDPLLNRVVALKVISETVGESDELRARFFREAKACAQLNHPNIITIYDLGEDAGRLFIVMEYLEGEELRQVIGRRRDLALESKLALMVQICEGLAYAHQRGIIHRDIKPGNIFISHNGVAKILDFGLARIASANDDLTRTSLFLGTLRYMAPEQARGGVDQRSDMFAAAAMFYELVAYHPPLPADDPMALLGELHSSSLPSRFRPDPAIPEDLGAVMERALRTDPQERFRNMGEMREALNGVRTRLAKEAVELRRRLEAQAAEELQLYAHLQEQIEGEAAHEISGVPEDGAPVAMLEASCRESEDKLVHLRELVERASQLRPEFEKAVDSMRLGRWAAAEEAFELVVREMPEHVGAQEGLSQARAEALRVAEVKRAREAAAHAQHIMDELRQRAAPAAVQDDEGSWTLAEANRASGLSVLAEQDYGTAQERFEAAAEQYRAAIDAVDRRVRQLLEAARRSLADREFARGLTLVDEIKRLAPDMSEISALSLEAERGMQEEAERCAALERRYDAAAEKLAAGDLQGAIDALTALVEEEPTYDRARQLLDDASAQLMAKLMAEEEAARARQSMAEPREQSDDTVLRQSVPATCDDTTAFAEPPPAELGRSPDVPAPIEQPVPVEGMRAQPVLEPSPTEQPEARPRVGPAGLGWLRRPPGRRLVLAASGVLVLTIAIFFWVASVRHLESEVDRERKQVSVAREQAVKAEANRLAVTLFYAAEAKHHEAERLATAGRLRMAAETMRDAAVRYEEAGRAAKTVGVERAKADQARAVMVTAKERAARDIPEFKEALTHERDGDDRYDELAFQEAAKHFGAAAQLFATVPPAAPTPSPNRDAAPEIQEMLRLYAQVFEAKDLTLLQQIRPNIRSEELSRYQNVFDRTQSYKVNFKVESIKVNGEEAEVKGRREDIVVTSNGETIKTPREFRFRFKRSNDHWTIDAVR